LVKDFIIVYRAYRLIKGIFSVFETKAFQKANNKAKPPFRQFGLVYARSIKNFFSQSYPKNITFFKSIFYFFF